MVQGPTNQAGGDGRGAGSRCLGGADLVCFLLPLLPDPERTPSSERRRLASLGSLLDDQHWHQLLMVWDGPQLNLTVDKDTETLQVPAEFSRWSVLEVGVTPPRPPGWRSSLQT